MFSCLNISMNGELEESWVFDAKEPISCAPLIIEGQLKNQTRIVLTTNSGKVFLIDKQGNIDWVFDSAKSFSKKESLFLDAETINTINNTPIIIYDKNSNMRKILFGSENGNLYCVGNQGELLWKLTTKGPIRGSPISMRNKDDSITIICGSHDGNIYLVDLEGKLLKQIDVGKAIETTPTIINKEIVFGTTKGTIIAIDINGNVLWDFSTKKKLTAKIVVTDNEDKKILLAASQDNNLYALSKDGELLWQFPTKGALLSEVAIAQTSPENKEIIFGSCDNNVYCVTTEGELIWSYETEFWVTTTPVINNHNDQVFVIAGSYDLHVYVLDVEGSYELDRIPGLSGLVNQTTFQSSSMSKEVGDEKGKKLDKYPIDSYIVGSSIISSTSEVLVATKKGKLYNLQLK